MNTRRVFISAGELSGDIVAARLITEIRRRAPHAYVFGAGGPRMAAAGADIAIDTNEVGVIGVSETFRMLPAVFTAYRSIRRCVTARRPDVAVLIGNDVFNVLLARWLRSRRIPTVSYFPPQVWVWRSLARPIARSFDAIVTSFPEEYAVYDQAHADTQVRFVGHYLADDLRPVTTSERAAARDRLDVPEAATVVGILPGSRRDEVSALTPVLLDAAGALLSHQRSWRFVVATATTNGRSALGGAIASHTIAAHTSVSTDSHDVMRSADLLLVASGTASLEAALLGVPMVIAYKVAPVTHLVVRSAIALGLINSYVVGLPNLILGRPVVPEALQHLATPTNVADQAWALLSNAERMAEMRAALSTIASRLRGPRAISSAADAVLGCQR